MSKVNLTTKSQEDKLITAQSKTGYCCSWCGAIRAWRKLNRFEQIHLEPEFV